MNLFLVISGNNQTIFKAYESLAKSLESLSVRLITLNDAFDHFKTSTSIIAKLEGMETIDPSLNILKNNKIDYMVFPETKVEESNDHELKIKYYKKHGHEDTKMILNSESNVEILHIQTGISGRFQARRAAYQNLEEAKRYIYSRLAHENT